MIRIAFLAFFFGLLCPGAQVQAREIPREQAVSCIIGEAENQGTDGMSALAHALRTRGSTRGVYGCTSPRVTQHLYSAKVFVQALKAWEESRHSPDPTHGADHWLSRQDMANPPAWLKSCAFTVQIKDHAFYKCK
jgi:hypothetical protein